MNALEAALNDGNSELLNAKFQSCFLYTARDKYSRQWYNILAKKLIALNVRQFISYTQWMK